MVDFIHSAKKIELDLIKGDGAIRREVTYVKQISQQQTTLQQLTGDLATYKTANTKLGQELISSQQDVRDQVIKTREARLEIWLVRAAVVLYIAGKIKGVFP